MEIQLKRFDIKEIKDDKVIVLIGKRDTGKSFLCKDILSHHTNIPAGQVISGTESANEFYSKIKTIYPSKSIPTKKDYDKGYYN